MTEKICPGGLIENDSALLNAVINPNPNNPNIFFEYMDVVDHCKNTCTYRKTDECKVEHRTNILNIFMKHQKIST